MRTSNKKSKYSEGLQSQLREFDDRCPYHEGDKSYMECNCKKGIPGKE